ncbi:MAG: hypothetical protein JXB50_09785 [Spirochaetes bacterium]|nr:hypothetical protein [Spirochaetota bacterium]
MSKNFFLVIFLIIILNIMIYSKEYSINKIDLNELSYSFYNDINNDIKIFNNNLYIFSLKDYFKPEEKYKNQTQSNRGYLKEIIVLTENMGVNEIINKSINKFEYTFDYKYYYLDKNFNIIYHNSEDKESAPFLSKKIEIYDIKDNLIKTIKTPRSIEYTKFFIDNDILYYRGMKEPVVLDVEFDFCIYDILKINHKVIKKPTLLNTLTIINIFNNIIYLADISKSIYLYKKENINDSDFTTYEKRILLDDYLYLKNNLMFFRSGNYGLLVKNKTIYQIRFLADSEKQIINVSSKIRFPSKQTLIIAINPETEKLEREIRINYSPRKVYESPNSYDVDDEGNIYILDSKNKNIIKIDKSVDKLEINYDQ